MDSKCFNRGFPFFGAAALGVSLALAGTASAAPAHPAQGRHTDYVALGDSLASGPGIPDQIDANCARSNENYPSLVAGRLGARLTDVSCSGASTSEMTQPQGTAPPQFDALNRKTDLVTISIGVNNIGPDGTGFSNIIGTCASVAADDPAGTPCKDAFTVSGADQLRANIDAAAPKISATLAGVHRRAPHARVLLIGYPDLFPDDGSSCTSAAVPFASGDFAYLRDAEKYLNSTLARRAKLGGATYVDTYRPSVGHDMCEAEGTRWVEPVVPDTSAEPAHPNETGHQAMAAAIERALHTRS